MPVPGGPWPDDAPPRPRRLVRRVLSCFAPCWRRVALVLAGIGVSAALGLVPALVTRTLVDLLAHRGGGGGIARLALIVVAGVAATLAGGAVSAINAYQTTSISQRVMFDLRRRLFGRIVRQSAGFFASSRTGDLMSRMSSDVGGIQDVVANAVFGMVNAGAVAVSTLALMLSLSRPLTLASLALVPLLLLPARSLGRVNYRAQERVQRQLGELSAYLQEVFGISGILLVKAFGRERAEELRFDRLSADLRALEVRRAMVGRWLGLLGASFQALGPAALLLLGGALVLRGQTTLGTVVSVVTILSGRLIGSLGTLASLHVNVMGALALFQRIFEALDHPSDVVERRGARALAAVAGVVEFDDVTFAYPGAARPALRRFSLRVEPGQVVALVGPSGAGKTTATYLLARLYDPTAGAVRLDGVDLRDLTLASLARSVGVVFQDCFLFHGTVRDNLLLARPDATREQVESAARAARVHDLIESLPRGYDTVVGERGLRLSGGERQRVAIARLVLRDPRVVVLDEATSNLDSLSEHLIHAALRPLLAGRTAFVVAHRLSTVLAADVIAVLRDGCLVDAGSHRDLLARDGLYRELYERQLAGGAPGPAAATVAGP